MSMGLAGWLALLAAVPAPPARPYLGLVPPVDLARVLPPPPAAGSAAARADQRVFRETRTLAGTARWSQAARDARNDAFIVFAPTLGLDPARRPPPALRRLLDRLGGGGMVEAAKRQFAVRRPFLDQPGPICEPRTAHLAANGDYPSGHTTNGWAAALVMAELAPARATAILRRGREFGESRYLCGAHSMSAVQAGFVAGAVVAAMAHAAPGFATDLAAARAELVALTAARP